MRTISQTSQFKKDYKREAKGQHREALDAALSIAFKLLVEDKSLPDRYRDHALTGGYIHNRECHLRPDLLLIYKKPDDERLQLVRLGSHSELF